MKTCYMCEREKTSVEHIPPKCFFPDDPRFRKNLITVPSCDMHNGEKSKDDEYIRMIVTTNVGANLETAKEYHLPKIARAIQAKRSTFDLFFGTGKTRLIMHNGEPLVIGEIDGERLQSHFDRMVRGLYFHKTKHKFSGKIYIYFWNLWFRNKPNAVMDIALSVIAWYRGLLIPKRKYGDNQAFFYYQVVDHEGFIQAFRLVFNVGFEVIAVLDPS